MAEKIIEELKNVATDASVIQPTEKENVKSNSTGKKAFDLWKIPILFSAFVGLIVLFHHSDGFTKNPFHRIKENTLIIPTIDEEQFEAVTEEPNSQPNTTVSPTPKKLKYNPKKYLRPTDSAKTLRAMTSYDKENTKGLLIYPGTWSGTIKSQDETFVKVTEKDGSAVYLHRYSLKDASHLRVGDFVEINGKISDVGNNLIFLSDGSLKLLDKPKSAPKEQSKAGCIQSELNRLGENSGPVDGKIGNRTRAAYKNTSEKFMLIGLELKPLTSPTSLCAQLREISGASLSTALRRKIAQGELTHPSNHPASISGSDRIVSEDSKKWEKFELLLDDESAFEYLTHIHSYKFSSEAVLYLSNQKARKARVAIASERLGVDNSFDKLSYNYEVTSTYFDYRYRVEYNDPKESGFSIKYVLQSNCLTRAHAAACYLNKKCAKADYEASKNYASYSNTCLIFNSEKYSYSNLCDKIGNYVARRFEHITNPKIVRSDGKFVCRNMYSAENYIQSNWIDRD